MCLFDMDQIEMDFFEPACRTMAGRSQIAGFCYGLDFKSSPSTEHVPPSNMPGEQECQFSTDSTDTVS